MTVHFLPAIVRTRLRRPTVPPRQPYVDGLDSVIAFFTEIREFSIEAQERFARDHPDATPGQVMLELPAATLDGLLVDLDAARTYRNWLLRTRRVWVAGMIVAVVLNLVSAMVNVVVTGWE